jgi:hypothetical protein
MFEIRLRLDRMSVTLRAVLAVAIAAATLLVWAAVWYLGFALVRLAFVVGAPLGIRSAAALDVGWFLQWIVAALTAFLIFAVLARPSYIRLATQVWFLALCVCACSGVIGFRDLNIRSLLALMPATGVLAWILYLTSVRPNRRVKQSAPALNRSQ